jgi:hypothetical protein
LTTGLHILNAPTDLVVPLANSSKKFKSSSPKAPMNCRPAFCMMLNDGMSQFKNKLDIEVKTLKSADAFLIVNKKF